MKLTGTSLSTIHWMTDPLPKMDAAQLQAFQRDFEDHFRIRSTDDRMPILNTRREIPWQAMIELKRQCPDADDILGVCISYGLDHDSFIPIIEFLKPGKDVVSPVQIIADYAHIWSGVSGIGFKIVDKTEQGSLVGNYLRDVRVARTAPGIFSDLNKPADAKPDPTATLFPWDEKLVLLFHDNPILEDRFLVITCISGEAAHYGSAQKEYRHGLSLHVARPMGSHGAPILIDQLNTVDYGTTAMKAVDLGALCPPNCPQGKP